MHHFLILLILPILFYFFVPIKEYFISTNPCIKKCRLNATISKNKCNNLNAPDIATCVHNAYNNGLNCEFNCQIPLIP